MNSIVPSGTSKFNDAYLQKLTYIGGGFIIEFIPNNKFPKSRLPYVGWTQEKMTVSAKQTEFTDDTNKGWQGHLGYADFPGALNEGARDEIFRLHLNICTRRYDFEWRLTITRMSYKNPDSKDIKEDINVTIRIN